MCSNKAEIIIRFVVVFGLILLPVFYAVPAISETGDDIEALNFIPDEAGVFTMASSNTDNPMQMEFGYESESESFATFKLLHGEAARMFNTAYSCNFDAHTQSEIAGNTFYIEHTERRDAAVAIARYYDGEIALEFEYRHGDSYASEGEVNGLFEEFLSEVDITAIRESELPVVPAQAEGDVDKQALAELIPESGDGLVKQDVVIYNDALHIRVDYIYEPDNTEYSYHLTYNQYSQRLYTVIGSTFPGSFDTGYEFCLGSDGDHMDVLPKFEYPSEEDIAVWELDNIDLTKQNPLAAYFPREAGEFEMTGYSSNVNRMTFTGEYSSQDNPGVAVSLMYGDRAIQQYSRSQLANFEDAMERFDSQGNTFYMMSMRGEYAAMTYLNNGFVLAARADGLDSDDEAIGLFDNMFSELDAARFAGLDAPEGFEMEYDGTLPDGTKHCIDPGCMDEMMAAGCEEAGFGGRLPGRIEVVYKVEESAGDQCRMSMTYWSNPNSDWENQPLYFDIDSDAGFAESVPEAVTDCMEGRTEAHNCHGPLLEQLGD